MEQPIFIFGQPRSGSTLLQRLINSYDDVIIYGEHLGALRDIALSYHRFIKHSKVLPAFWETNVGRPKATAQALARLKDARDFAPRVNGLTRVQFQDCYRNFLRSLIHNIPVPPHYRWGFKEVCYLETENTVFGMLKELFPACRMIFLVRHPADQIASKEATGWWPDSIEAKTQNWITQTQSYLSYTRAHADHAILIKYEEMICREASAADRMLKFIGYEFGPAQQAILFELARIGGVKKRIELSPEVRQTILTQCVAAGHGELYDR